MHKPHHWEQEGQNAEQLLGIAVTQQVLFKCSLAAPPLTEKRGLQPHWQLMKNGVKKLFHMKWSSQKEYIKPETQGSGSTVRGMLAISTEAFIYSVSKANPGQFTT